MKDNALMRNAITRNITVLETADPASAEFRRAKAVVEAYRHEEVMSAHKEKIASDRKLVRLTCGLLLFTLILAFLTVALVLREWFPRTTPTVSKQGHSPVAVAMEKTTAATGKETVNPINWSAFFSAIAAIGAAICAFLNWRMQRTNYLESVRPELEVEGWARIPSPDVPNSEVVTFHKIRNVGRGVATHVDQNYEGTLPNGVVSIQRIGVIGANQEKEMDGTIRVSWNCPADETTGVKCIPLSLNIVYWDIADRRYETQYTLDIYSPVERVQGSDPVAPGVFLNYRKTTIESGRLLRLHTNVRMLCRWLGIRIKPRHSGVVISSTSRSIRTDN